MVRRHGALQPVSWEEALSALAEGLRAASDRGGADSIGFLGSARASNEDNLALARLARQCVGTNNVDFSPRLGLDLRVGWGWRGTREGGIDPSRYDLVLVAEGDLCTETPVLAGHLIDAARRGLPLVVMGPRRTQLAESASTWLQFRPGGGAWALMAVLRLLSREHREWVSGFGKADEAARAWVHGLDAPGAAAAAGLTVETVSAVADMLASAERVLLVYSHTYGFSVSGEQAVSALLALGAWSGLVAGRRFDVVCSSTYPNGVGARAAGVIPHALRGRGDECPDGERLAARWGCALPERQGAAFPAMLEKVKCLYVMQDDPLRHAVEPERMRACLEQMDFVVVQDFLSTELEQYADVVLPCAGPGEYLGTMVTMGGLVQMQRAAVKPPGQALPAWQALGRLAEALGADWKWDSAEQAFEDLAAVVPAFEGVNLDAVAQDKAHLQPSRATGAIPPLGPLAETETPDAEYPLIVLADATLEFLASDPVTAHSATLGREILVPIVKRVAGMTLVHPKLMQSLEVRRGTAVRLSTRQGSVELPIAGSEAVAEGLVLLPHAVALQHAGTLGMRQAGRGEGMRLAPRAAKVEVMQKR
jgi:predicted molibdopterin-dependent oxidoreductase YjgC